MSEQDAEPDRSNRRLRPWGLGLLALVIIGYGGFALTRDSGWSIIFGLLMVTGGLAVIVVIARELVRYRRAKRKLT